MWTPISHQLLGWTLGRSWPLHGCWNNLVHVQPVVRRRIRFYIWGPEGALRLLICPYVTGVLLGGPLQRKQMIAFGVHLEHLRWITEPRNRAMALDVRRPRPAVHGLLSDPRILTKNGLESFRVVWEWLMCRLNWTNFSLVFVWAWWLLVIEARPLVELLH